jgi:hypothetical protein
MRSPRSNCGGCTPLGSPHQSSSAILPKWPPRCWSRKASAMLASGKLRSTTGRMPMMSRPRTMSCRCRRLPTTSPCRRCWRMMAPAPDDGFPPFVSTPISAMCPPTRVASRAASADLDEVVDAAAPRQISHDNAPLLMGAIVDGMVGASARIRSSFSSEEDVASRLAVAAIEKSNRPGSGFAATDTSTITPGFASWWLAASAAGSGDLKTQRGCS